MTTGPPPAKPPILLVDDEPEILYSLQGLLRREFTLHTATSGPEALAILRQHPIHVIMTDQRMPEMTGAELVGHVKTEHPDAIRIIFTGYADIKAVVEAINHGGIFRYITKPWDPDELIAVLREAASVYQRVTQRRQLLADLRQYVEEAQRLARGLREQGGTLDPAAANRLVEGGDELLGRIAGQEDIIRP